MIAFLKILPASLWPPFFITQRRINCNPFFTWGKKSKVSAARTHDFFVLHLTVNLFNISLHEKCYLSSFFFLICSFCFYFYTSSCREPLSIYSINSWAYTQLSSPATFSSVYDWLSFLLALEELFYFPFFICSTCTTQPLILWIRSQLCGWLAQRYQHHYLETTSLLFLSLGYRIFIDS